jgi:hypothetical protein
MAENNGNHPKAVIEMLADTHDTITAYAASKGIGQREAIGLMILNELRCIHWHMDVLHASVLPAKKEGAADDN